MEIVKFFQSGMPPVASEETLELLAFMEAADKSKYMGGIPVEMEFIWKRAKTQADKYLKK